MISVLVLVHCNYSFLPQVKNPLNKMEGLGFLYEAIDNYNLILKLRAETTEEIQQGKKNNSYTQYRKRIIVNSLI